jgi:threonyl-tRNA synthetase
MVRITLPDGTIKEFETSVSGFEIAHSISESLARESIAIKVNGTLQDITDTITEDSTVEIITSRSPESLEILRHTSAHIFAQALLRIYPKALVTIGPATENGFYYDVDCEELTEDDLPKIEQEMQNIIKEDIEIIKEYKTLEETKEFFKNNPYKLEIIRAIQEGKLSQEEQEEVGQDSNNFQFYTQKEFSDLCRGPHLPRTGLVKAFKLEKITKAYWRGDANNKQLSRVYGTAFWKKSDLDEYFKLLEEAKKRDHRILGKKMNLFMIHEYAPGMTFFLDRGFYIWKQLQSFIREQYKKYDYKEVMTPNMFNKKLWEISGHATKYADDMFNITIEGQEFSLKPMNCPSHCLIFKNSYRSYKELPLRIADFGALHRNELSGTLSGLTRVRKFCQDDAHIFCTLDHVEEEIRKLLELVDYVYKDVFKMSYEIELSTRPDNALGSKEIWDRAESALAQALEKNGKAFEICEGDGAFYGPKIDFRIKDCLGRIWQTATIQLDFNLPERFDLTFDGKQGQERPVMIHRAILGSLERFMGVMIEHFAGKFPLWLSPVQVKIINVADRHVEYCEAIKKELEKEDFRIETNYDSLGVGKKIALARDEDKPNYMIVIGDNDVENKTISVRTRKFENGKNEEFTTTLEEFKQRLLNERDTKEIYY